jgi:DNA invertase Pin-like site-specific DNA recombinase
MLRPAVQALTSLASDCALGMRRATEFERELIRERTIAGLVSARARGRNGGRPDTMTSAKLRLAQAAMATRGTKVGDLCKELGVTRRTLYRFVDPKGGLRADGTKLLN